MSAKLLIHIRNERVPAIVFFQKWNQTQEIGLAIHHQEIWVKVSSQSKVDLKMTGSFVLNSAKTKSVDTFWIKLSFYIYKYLFSLCSYFVPSRFPTSNLFCNEKNSDAKTFFLCRIYVKKRRAPFRCVRIQKNPYTYFFIGLYVTRHYQACFPPTPCCMLSRPCKCPWLNLNLTCHQGEAITYTYSIDETEKKSCKNSGIK